MTSDNGTEYMELQGYKTQFVLSFQLPDKQAVQSKKNMKDIGTGSTSASTREPTSIFLSCRGRLLGPTVVTTGSVKLPSNRSMRPPGPSSANSSTVAGNLFPCTDTNHSWVIMPSWWSNAHELQSSYCTKMPLLSFNMLGLGVTSRKECFRKRSPWLSTLKKIARQF